MGTSIRYPLLSMRTGVSQMNNGAPGGTLPGWLSGNPANAGASSTTTVVFDLGLDWQQYGIVQLTVTGTAAFTSLAEQASDDGLVSAQDLIATNGSPLSLALSAAGSAQGVGLVAGRYVRVVLVNGGSAQGAGALVRLVAHPA